MAIQQLMLGVGAKKKKTYIDDVVSTQLYLGNATARNVNNGIDLSSEGGLVWFKNRDSGNDHYLFDTVRGKNSYLSSNSSAAAGVITSGDSNYNNMITSFNNNGFSLGTSGVSNTSGDDMAAWSFRKAKGFFDVVTYSGTGSKRTVNHSLGCKPGMIVIKRTDTGSNNWDVWHRGMGGTVGGNNNYMVLNDTTRATSTSRFGTYGTDDPTSTTFTVKDQSEVNASGGTYVAYLFAGGASTAATARSVRFDGTGDYLNTTSSSSDLSFGTGDFTIEFWVKPNGSLSNKGLLQISANSGGLGSGSTYWTHPNSISLNTENAYTWTAWGQGPKLEKGQWTHIAVVRNSGTTTVYFNGDKKVSGSDTNNYSHGYIAIGGYWDTDYLIDADFSNVRVVKGTAVYTSSFRVPTEPLANISGTVLLCCNGSSVTSSTVTPQTLNSNGDPTASTDSPFDDPAAFKFGENGDQNVIKCGSYVGNGSSTGPEINLGWEPQWVMIKNTESAEAWAIYDSMRGIVSGGNDPGLYPNTTNSEYSANIIDLTSTGFKLVSSAGDVNENNKNFIYVCIRRSDGYCGKPADAGTDVFSLVLGDSSLVPQFRTGFPMDFAMTKEHASSSNWHAGSRLTGDDYLHPNTSAAAQSASWLFGASDYNNGYAHTHYSSSDMSWAWKRHAGFDVVTYTGNGTAGRQIPHSLNGVPEFMWAKPRNNADHWKTYHKGYNGGTTPENYTVNLNDSAAEWASSNIWNNTAPTSTHFTVGTDNGVNANSWTYIVFLFRSVDGISKVGYYTGNGSTTGPIITTGFTPRLIIIKRADDSGSWYIYDTVRGLATGTDQRIELNDTSAQYGNDDLDPTTTGFQLKHTWDNLNGNGGKYIYYAHA